MIPYLKLILGLIFCVLGYCYMHKISLIYRINRALRETLLNDSYCALIKEKAALLFWLAGLLLLYMGLTSVF